MVDRQNLTIVEGYLPMRKGASAAVAPANEGRYRYNEVLQRWEKSENNQVYKPLSEGAAVPTYRSVVGNTTALVTDHTIDVDASGGDATVSLPAVATVPGQVYVIAKSAGPPPNRVIIDPDGAETINGDATVELIFQFDILRIQSTGTEWRILW